jgi:xanthine dehydrogenase YagR molybdenum-binding subunit
MAVANPAVGASLDRVEGREKVTGEALYAYEHEHADAAYAVLVQATIAKGEMVALETAAALALPGVLAVLSHENAPRLSAAEGELAVLQSRRIHYRGQIVAAVIAESLEVAEQGAGLVRARYSEQAPDVELRRDHPRLYKPVKVNPSFPTDTSEGDLAAGLAEAAVVVDETYETPHLHTNPATGASCSTTRRRARRPRGMQSRRRSGCSQARCA